MTTAVGNARVRVDAETKVRGAARYTAEHDVENMVYGVLALSRIANGRITAIDTSAAEALPNVIGVMTHRNAPRVNGAVTGQAGIDKHLLLMQDDRIEFDRQRLRSRSRRRSRPRSKQLPPSRCATTREKRSHRSAIRAASSSHRRPPRTASRRT